MKKESNVVLNFKMDGQIEYAKTIRDINAIMNAAASEYKTHVAAMGKDADATKKLTAEKKKLEIQMEAAKERTEMLRSQYEAMAKDTNTTTGQLANKYKQLQNSERAELALEQALERVNDGLSEQAEESRKAEQALNELESEAESLETQTEKLNAEYELQVAQLGDNASETDKLKLKMEHLNDTHELAKEKVENYEEQLEQAKLAYGENSEEVDKYEIQLLEARTAEQQLANEIATTNKKLEEQSDVLKQTSDRLKETGDKMKETGKSLSTKVTAPLTGIAAAATKIGMDYQSAMSEVQAISGATGDDLQALEEKAREMGATTNKSAKEAADAMGYMALAGWDTQQIIGGIEPVLKLSSAGNMDLARTSDLVTDSMSALQLSVEDLPGFLDMVAEASRQSNTDMDALMEAYLVAGGTMASFNVPLEESTSLLGILANRGLKGSEAGTALNAIFTNLTSGAGKAGKALDELGISAFDQEGNFKGLEAVLFEVKEKTADMTEEQQAQYITMLAGKEHLKSFQSLMAGLGDEYGDLKDDVSDATGALDEMYDIMTDNLKGRWDEFKSAMEEAGIAIFENLQPALESVLGYLQKAVDWFNNLSPAMQNTIIIIGGLAAAVGPLLIVFGMMANGLSSIIALVAKFAPLAKALVGVIGGISAPVLGVIAAITALIAIGIALYKNWDTIKEKAVEIWGAVADFFSGIWEFIKDIFNQAMDFITGAISETWELIGEGITQFWEGIVQFFAGTWELIKNIFLGAFLVIFMLITGQWEEIGEVTSQIWGNITEALGQAWEGIKDIFFGSLTAILEFVGNIWENIKEVWGAATDWLDEKTGGKFSEMLEVVTNFMKMIWENIKAVWDFIKNTFNTVLSFIKSLVSGDFEGMKNAISKQMENIRNLISTIWNNIKKFFSDILSNILSTVKEKFSNMVSSVKDKMDNVFTTIKDIWDNVMTFFTDIDLFQIGKDIIQGLIDGITSMVGAVADAVKNVTDKITGKVKSILGIKSPSRVMMEIGRYVTEGLGLGIEEMGDFAVNKTADVSNAITGAMQDGIELPELEMGTVVTQPASFTSQQQTYDSGLVASLGNIGSNIKESLQGLSGNISVNVFLDTKQLNTELAPGMSVELNNMNKMNARSQGVITL